MKRVVVLIFLWTTFQLHAQDNIVSYRQITARSFLYERVDFEAILNSSFVNPYDAREIALDLILTTPSAKVLSLPCFYVSGDSRQSVWNARFLPQETGRYSFYFKLTKNQTQSSSSVAGEFLVSPSAKNGILHMNTNWSFKYDSGKLFRGIGENVGWEARDWENQTYRYDYFLPKLARNGANFFRSWTCIWNLPIEWQTIKDTKFYKSSAEYFNPSGIKRMDELIEMIDSLDMHMMLSLVPHGALITSGEWPYNPYNVKNGGPASSPTEFFTLDQSKERFKNTLRYLVARWGYSPGIGVWEFFNEIDNAAYNGGSSLVIPEAAITQWHTEMSAYLKKIDIYRHPISTSISHREIKGLFNVPDLDFNQQHIYNNTSSMPSKIQYYENACGKPHVIGEYGWDWDWNNVTAANGSFFDFDLKRGMWYGLFSSTPILPMSWWWEFFDGRNMTSYYNNIASVSEKMFLSGDGDFKTATVTTSGFERYAVQCGNDYFVYLLNNSSGIIENNVKLTVEKSDPYFMTTLNPATGKYSEIAETAVASGMINLGQVVLNAKEERVYIFTQNKESVGVVAPYSGKPQSLPGTVELENFDKGGDGISWHDSNLTNEGGAYRSDSGVDIYSSGGNWYVGNTVKGEWLNYSVVASETGIYSVDATVASASSGKTFRLLMDSLPISGAVVIPQTGSADTWQTISVPLTVNKFTAGSKVLTVEFLDADLSMDKLTFKLENSAPVVQLKSPAADREYNYPVMIDLQAEASDKSGTIAKVAFYAGTKLIGEDVSVPYGWSWSPSVGRYAVSAVATDNSGLTTSSGVVWVQVHILHAVPGTIQTEDYEPGENGTAYVDLSSGNKFGFYRSDDVDLEACSDDGGGYSVGDFQSGEWLTYKINVAKSGSYKVDIRVASLNGGLLSLSVDGKTVAGNINVPGTGGWQTWSTVSTAGIQLTEGEHVLSLGSVTQFVNVNKLIFTNTTAALDLSRNSFYCYPNPVTSVLYLENIPERAALIQLLNISGVIVQTDKIPVSSINVAHIIPGIYNLRILSSSGEPLTNARFIKR